jgi:hypothetical protein
MRTGWNVSVTGIKFRPIESEGNGELRFGVEMAAFRIFRTKAHPPTFEVVGISNEMQK